MVAKPGKIQPGTVLFLFCGLAVLAEGCATSSNLEPQIETFCRNYSYAIKNRDMDCLYHWRTENFSRKSTTGEVQNREEELRQLSKILHACNAINNAEVKIVSLEVSKTKARAIVIRRSEAEVLDEDGQRHIRVDFLRSRDFWVKTANGWKLEEMHELQKGVYIDGKSISFNSLNNATASDFDFQF